MCDMRMNQRKQKTERSWLKLHMKHSVSQVAHPCVWRRASVSCVSVREGRRVMATGGADLGHHCAHGLDEEENGKWMLLGHTSCNTTLVTTQRANSSVFFFFTAALGDQHDLLSIGFYWLSILCELFSSNAHLTRPLTSRAQRTQCHLFFKIITNLLFESL